MQLKSKISIAAALVLVNSLNAEDYVRVNYMQYNESDSRIQVQAPSLEVNKDFGVDYTLNVKYISDAVSGGTPIYSDTTSGASAFHRGTNISTSNIKKENVEMTENRNYVSASLVKRFENRDELTMSFSNSYESDYSSNTLSADYLMYEDSTKNRSYNVGVSYQANRILIRECNQYNYICDGVSGASAKEDASLVATEIGVTQIIDKNALAKLSVFYGKEDGYLSNPYYNVVRNNDGTNGDVVAERRPDKRTNQGVNMKYIRAMTPSLTSQFRYKYYKDDWDIVSHTFDINNYYEIGSKYILGFGLRYYTQSEANFYNESLTYFTDQTYASHDDRLSSFDSKTYKLSLDYKYNEKVSYNFGYNIYTQSTGLNANYLSVGLKYNF